jgi:triosephosphate isomerase (TIM)
MASRQPLVAANWKMNGTLGSIRPLVEAIKNGLVDDDRTLVVICAPYIYLPELQVLLQGSRLKLGAQNVSQSDSGAYTGEISVAMLQDYNCQYVIVGHSERRNLYQESDHLVAEKFVKVSKAGLIPILCLGELLQERESGTTDEVIARQLDEVIKLAGIEQFKNAVIAYEPVWAIGTGLTASPEQAEEVHGFIRLQLARHNDEIADNIKILYGGSVKADNAGELFSRADIDGGLIGGASLNAQEFLKICESAR